jgi:transposase
MSASYAAAVAKVLPKAKLVHDRFHISKLLGDAVDKVRRSESKELAAQDDDRLKGTRYLWLWHPGELKESRLNEFESLAFSNLRTARAYYHRIQFLEFWEQPDLNAAQNFFALWYHEALRSGLEPIQKVARTLQF